MQAMTWLYIVLSLDRALLHRIYAIDNNSNPCSLSNSDISTHGHSQSDAFCSLAFLVAFFPPILCYLSPLQCGKWSPFSHCDDVRCPMYACFPFCNNKIQQEHPFTPPHSPLCCRFLVVFVHITATASFWTISVSVDRTHARGMLDKTAREKLVNGRDRAIQLSNNGQGWSLLC